MEPIWELWESVSRFWMLGTGWDFLGPWVSSIKSPHHSQRPCFRNYVCLYHSPALSPPWALPSGRVWRKCVPLSAAQKALWTWALPSSRVCPFAFLLTPSLHSCLDGGVSSYFCAFTRVLVSSSSSLWPFLPCSEYLCICMSTALDGKEIKPVNPKGN